MAYLLIPLLPFAAFLILGLFGHWIKDKAHVVAIPAVVLSWILSAWAFLQVAEGLHPSIPLYTWLTSGDLRIGFGLSIDRLTAVMLLLVSTVSTLVHIYTIGYMHGEKGYARFFAYIALFTSSMLMLVMADNLLQLFVFWEAVGLCSYLLIGHWYDRPSACSAATKAFLVNRIGDVGFLLGVVLVWYHFGSLEYQHVFAQAAHLAGHMTNLLDPFGGTWEISTLTLICLLLFVGAVGKSAQVPLHVWLPDAMEGPTPISALIHAATMVTAGVFLVARLHPLYNLSTTARTIVAITGAATMLLGSTIALAQYDIKRIVAYSTISQLGYMMMACGLGAYAAGIYHLLTHGAFKALLFLGCGAVIFALHHEQDMRRMGGLKDCMPVTYWTFVIGALALVGFPFTAGFFSKEAVLLSAWSAGPLGHVLTGVGLLTTLLTAFYTFRLVFVMFWGSSRNPWLQGPKHPHTALFDIREPSAVMTVPLIILAALSVVTGYLGIEDFLIPALPGPSAEHARAAHRPTAIAMTSVATLTSLIGIATAWYAYVRAPGLAGRLARQWPRLYRGLLNKWFVDEAYDRLVVHPTFALARWLWKTVDVVIIDGAVNGIARALAWGGLRLRRCQSGQTQHYALGMALGIVVILGMLLLW
jgi:NADH-quinone oxidoreductase subunit L